MRALFMDFNNDRQTWDINNEYMFGKALLVAPIVEAQYTGEKSWDNLTIKVFPEGSGSFTLYEDEGDNYNYEKEAYTEINMTWNDKSQMFTIAPRKGNYEGMITNRTFNVELPNGKKQSVSYNGKQIKVKL